MRRISKITTIALLVAFTTFVSAIPVSAKTVKVAFCKPGAPFTQSSYAIVETTSVDAKVKPIYSTQAEHKKGTALTIGVEKSVTKTVNISATVSWEWNAGLASASATLGIDDSESVGISSTVSYSLHNERSGRYRIETVFPGKKVKYDGYTTYKNKGNLTLKEYSKTISYAPNKNSGYRRLKRYAGL